MLTRRPPLRILIGYLLIPLALYVFAVFIPLITAAFYSMFEWKGGPNKTFTGIANYIALIQDKIFWLSFSHNLYLILLCVIGQVGVAFVFVMMINTRFVKLKSIHRTFGFFPSTIAAVYVGFIWLMIYDSRRGILNWFLELIGREDLTQVWLNNTDLVMTLVSIPLIWQYIGYYMLILLSATSSIDKEIFESAELDGANAFQRSIHIVLPMIKNTVIVCLVLCVSGNMKAFDNIYVMTAGGPGNNSMVLAMYGYKVSFAQQNMGYGSAISVGIFVLGLLVIGGMQLVSNKLSKD
ncbi:MAG: sugar ABC transporter permease [Eubacteriales bacterium]|nr:sugar ABC transporter permease [Eubacteriales bacterium]MDD3504150.1 sugar ABC transporter permease [Eubacteriales bacterium]MDD4681915.1 sugar ABC transporter permease [Eubacteriales bacterium]